MIRENVFQAVKDYDKMVEETGEDLIYCTHLNEIKRISDDLFEIVVNSLKAGVMIGIEYEQKRMKNAK